MALKPYRATSHWKKIRLKVLNRDAWTCNYCGESANEVDHVYPKSKGGEDTLDNLVAACRRCNIKKKDAVFLGNNSPKGANQSKSVQNGHTTVHVDADSPFISPGQSGAN
jgi:5-methylcytosine-specific restriction endonuclease McrA